MHISSSCTRPTPLRANELTRACLLSAAEFKTMDWGDDNDDDDANDFLTAEQDNAVAPDFSVKDSILFVIDARAHMCQPPAGGGPSCFAQSLQCVLACMKDRVLGGERDLVGVLLFGTREAKLPSQSQPFPHLYLLQELEEPSADSMRHISLVANAAAANDGSSGGAKTEDAYGGSAAIDFGQMDAGATLDMSNVLWVTSILFAHSKNVKNMRRRVYLMTNDDSPCGADKGAHARALTRSRDLQDANIWIEPFFFAPPPPKGPAFDLSERSFWRELISGVRENYKPPKRVEEKNDAQQTAAAENGTTTASTTANVEFTGEEIVKTVGGSIVEDKSDAWLRNCVAHTGEDLLERVRRTAHRKKVQWTSELTVGEGMSLSFVMVGMVHPAPRPTAKKLEAKTNDEIESNTAFMDAADGSALEKSEIYKTYAPRHCVPPSSLLPPSFPSPP